MVREIKLQYIPISSSNGELSENDFDNYVNQIGLNLSDLASARINGLEENIKNSEETEFLFRDLKVKKSTSSSVKVSWEKVYSSLLKFLEIRAEDSRASKIHELEYFDGLGYCISLKALNSQILNETNTASNSSIQTRLTWPRISEENYASQIVIPSKDIKRVNEDNLSVAWDVKRFCSGFKKQVLEAFKETNKLWHESETGFNEKNPYSENIDLTRQIAEGKYVFVNLVRVETPNYKEIIETLSSELNDLENGVALENYKLKRTSGGVYVNIKNVFERLSKENLQRDGLVNIKGRYEIIP
jgi:hypothetical protein